MNKLTTGFSVVLVTAIGVACHLDGIVGSPEHDFGGKQVDKITTTYEAEWVGSYEGTGSAELLDTGDSYADLPACLETWVEAGRLHGVVHIPLGDVPSDALIEISDRDYWQDQDGLCAGIGVTMTASCSTEDVTSMDRLLLFGVRNSSWDDSKPQLSLRIERRGDKLVGLLEVELLEHRLSRSSGNNSTLALFSLYVAKVN